MSIPGSEPPSFDGRRVATFESRLTGVLADMIVKHGGVPLQAPALREIPFGANAEALDFADRLLAGRFDIVIFLTGVGTRFLAQAIETRHDRASWTAALARTKVVVRGPKPLVPLRELKVRVDVQAPEPNTWHEVLAALDAQLPVAGQRVAVQEYGKSNPELIAGLEGRGAEVSRVPVYRWALPEDTTPLAPGHRRDGRRPGGIRSLPRLSRSSTCSRSPPRKGRRWPSVRRLATRSSLDPWGQRRPKPCGPINCPSISSPRIPS